MTASTNYTASDCSIATGTINSNSSNSCGLDRSSASTNGGRIFMYKKCNNTKCAYNNSIYATSCTACGGTDLTYCEESI
jgi:hypothetical protein